MIADSRVRGVVVSGAVAVGLIVGIGLGFLLEKESPREPRSPASNSPQGPGPFREENGVPVGYAQTQEGAVAAAANFTLLSADDRLLDEDALALAMETVAAPGWKSEARTQAAAGTEFILDRYGDDANLTGSVLRYAISDYSSHRAVIELWTVSLIYGSDRPNVEEVWSTVTVDLAWADGDWRVEGHDSVPGPTPVDIPSAEATRSAIALMEDFLEFGGGPTP